MIDLARAWMQAAEALGGQAGLAAADGDWLAAQYDAPSRSYHGTAHIDAVLRGIDDLAPGLGLDVRELAIARAAGCAHDVVYAGAAGEDEAASAYWARAALLAAGADPAAAQQVADIIAATADHHADSPAALAVMDADLAILAADPAAYEAYRQQVRAEYRRLDDGQWRAGRSAVLRSLLERDELFLSPAARERWEAAARRNIAAELAALG